tara:strand:+ start:303 stop:1127 length:825 start_codon:yes stop_codon:yes gene_type:complete
MITWISSYPKSGNTWVRTFISTYYFSNNDSFEFSLLKNIKQFPHEKFMDKNITDIKSAINKWNESQIKINSEHNSIFLKTHSALVKINNISFTSSKHTIGGIYIVRDPRNVITSISNHYQLNFEDALKFMTNKRKYLINKNNYANFTFLNSWSEHYKSWIKNKSFNILFIKYEDLERDTFVVFKKIVKFLNKILNKKENINNVRLKKIIDSISFERLKEKEKREGFAEAIVNNQNQKINFFNLGKKNNWEKLLSENQIRTLNEVFKEDLKILNY